MHPTIINYKTLLFVTFFISVLCSQVTINDTTRIPIPFKEISVVIFLILSPILILQQKGKYRTLSIVFIFVLYISCIATAYALTNFHNQVDGIPIPIIIFYSLIFVLGTLYSQICTNAKSAIYFYRLGMNLIFLSICIAIVLYLMFFSGANQIMLGVNHAASYRAFGLYPEPSHFSIFAAVGVWCLLYSVNLKIIEKDKIYYIYLLVFVIGLVISFSPTGYALFLVIAVFNYASKLGIRSIFTATAILVTIYFLSTQEFFDRGLSRIYYEVDLLFRLVQGGNLNGIEEFSRLGRLIITVSKFWDTATYESVVVGLGTGGQFQIFKTVNSHLGAPIAIFVEFGLIGTTLFTVIIIMVYFRSFINIWPILLPYIAISTVNSPGGIFYMQFGILLFLILNLGQAVKAKVSEVT